MDTESEKLARFFHDTYETLAPSFGYETRKDTRDFNPESQNGRLMVTVCGAVLLRFNSELANESEKNAILEKDTSRLRDCIRQGAENIRTLQKQIRALEHEVDKYQALAAERWNQLYSFHGILADYYETIERLISLLERK